MKRINTILALEEDPVSTSKTDPLKGLSTFGVECRDLTFRYNNEKTVFNGLSLLIPAGKRVALVGVSGGGN